MTNLGEVRRAADRLYGCSQQQLNLNIKDVDILTDFVKQLLPESDFGPDGEPLPVTEEWLREVWGYEYDEEKEDYVTEHDECIYEMSLSIGGVWTLYWDEIESWPVDIRYRHQFRQIATALGLAPRKAE